MKLEILKRHLAIAESRIFEEDERIAQQESVVNELRRAGRAIALASSILMTMKQCVPVTSPIATG